MSSTIRVGIAGAGFSARIHLSSWQRVHGVPVEIAGVYSRSAEKRESFAQSAGLKSFDSWKDLLANADAVDICTPGVTHEKLAVEALRAGRNVIVEKPYTGYYGPAGSTAGDVNGFNYDRSEAQEQVKESCRRLREAIADSGRTLCYAENWIYAPAVQKEREILEKSRGQILRILGEESHSGSHAVSYGHWRESGGGALGTKGCHPLSAAIYFKWIEGRTRLGRVIQPVRVSAHSHRLTQLPGFVDEGTLRTDYTDTEDYGQLHVTFEDGMVADILASDVVLGGVANWIEVFSGNHRTRCNLCPIDALESFVPESETMRDVYVVEKIHPKHGWMKPAPDEDWQHGYHSEMQAFAEALASGKQPESSWQLGEAVSMVLAGAYLSASRNGEDVEIGL